MADYWKSQPRKFCDFCKCWIADNKPSRDFHEKGKRHQESVKQKLDQLKKKGVEDARKEKETSDFMKMMEKGALKKLREDLASNPSLASQYGVNIDGKTIINNIKDTKQESKKTKTKELHKSSDEELISNTAPMGTQQTETQQMRTPTETQPTEVWNEAYTPEGYVYYWNSITGESTWELPDSKVPPTANQSGALPAQESEAPPLPESETLPAPESIPLPPQESETALPTQKSGAPSLQESSSFSIDLSEIKLPDDPPTEVKKKEQIKEIKEEKIVVQAPRKERQTNPYSLSYGAWQDLKQDEEPLLDLDLPVDSTQHTQEVQISIPISNEPKLKFVEKKVKLAPVGNKGEVVTFKKRKLNTGGQKNIRRTDDDQE